jgi:D-alanyl-D-alanine carboxypeptidase/D-alanyl-D-alanine-endopeptidase (penicillin-binding protein 4)
MKTGIRIYIISMLLLGSISSIFGQTADSLYAIRKAKAEEAVMAFTSDPVFSQAVLSICVTSGNGETLASHNAHKMVVPASNMKLITTGAAIHALGKDYRYESCLGYKGKIQDGVLNGDLYILGSGDPTLGSRDSIATPLEMTFLHWKNMLEKSGIRKINGHIIGDGRAFEGMPEEESWLWNDIGTYYGTGVSALNFYENMQSFSVTAGAAPGEPVSIAPQYPIVPWMEFRYNCRTGEKGTGDKLYMYTSDLAPVAEIRGTFAVDRGKKRVDCSNKFPELTCAKYFADWLQNNGIPCTKGAADTKLKTDWMTSEIRDSMVVIGSSPSPALKRIIHTTNHASNNLYADALFRTIGKTSIGKADYASSAEALKSILKSMGLDTSKGLYVKDGSGLSRQNLVSADFFCRFLEAMMHSPAFEEYVESLPSPGGNGTLQYNMKNHPVELRSRLKVKSGSMNGIRCYSGYIIPREGTKNETIIFSILTSNCTSPTWKVRPMLDKLMAALAEIN